MSFPDYEQKCNDHKSLLILVKSIHGRSNGTQLSTKTFNKIYERIAYLDELCIEDAQGMGCQRLIKLRYKKNEYENENNDWGDFQCHRKLLGLITVAKYNGSESDLEDVYGQYQNSVDKYSSTLYDSRCILFKVRPDTGDSNDGRDVSSNNCSPQTNGDSCESNNDPLLHPLTRTSTTTTTSPTALGDHSKANSEEGAQKTKLSNDNGNNGECDNSSTNDCNSTNSISNASSKLSKQLTQCLIYNCVNQEIDVNSIADQLEKDVKDLISSLFWVLESKRMDRSFEKMDRIPLLMAPFETKALVGLDMDSKIFKKKCLGRMRKYMGDLSLLAGLPSEALTYYGNSIDTLRSANDWLWLASALEGQCVASVTLLYPQTMRRRSSLQRNSSLPASKFRRMQEEANANSNESSKARNQFSRKVLLSGSSRSLPNGDPIVAKAMGKFLLNSITEIYERYKESCCHYAKYRNASVVELECSFKAARMLTFHEKYLYASEFIQNAVFISINQSNEEQIKRLCFISELYSDIGYNRKAAFYRRFAALKAVAINVNNPNWKQCYHLLLPSLEGYQLTLDPVEYDKRIKRREFGWFGIHLQLLQELITTAKRMSTEQIAIRHLSFLLHSLFEFLNTNQRKEFAKQLEQLSATCGEGAPVPLTLSTGIIIPSVNLTKFPCVTSFKVQNLPPRLRPVQLKAKHRESVSSPASPFIFTPLQLSRPSSARRKSSATITAQPLDFKWIDGEECRVLVNVINYLPIELNVNHMSLMTDGIAYETYPTSVTLQPESGLVTVELTGTPRGSGKLDILGYTTHVLGVKNNCKLKDLTNAKKMKFPQTYTIDVVPPLPLMDIACGELESLPVNSDSMPVVSSFKLSLFAGETKTYSLKVTNTSSENEMIEIMSVSLQSKLSKEAECEVISWDEDAIQSNLPLAGNSSFNFSITVRGVSDFVRAAAAPPQPQRKTSTASTKYRGASSGTASPLHSNYSSPAHAKKSNPNLLGTAFANFISDLQTSAHLSNAIKRKHASEPSIIESLGEFPIKSVELVVHIEYSGGAGLAAGYCRKCALLIDIEILPSLIITQWDVLPAERHDNCYLVFDVLNATNQEMELFYASNKSILIEAKETCRIPVPVERCPLIDANESGGNGGQDGDADYDYDNCEKPASRQALHARCKSYLDSQVHLKWLLAANERSGTASISDIPWTTAMLDAILMSSVKWDVTVNNRSLNTNADSGSGSEPLSVYKIGDVITVNVAITNCSGNALRSLCVCLQCYQDYENGHRNYRLDMKRVILGCDKVYIQQIESKEKYTHECSFIFLFTGVYKMDIQCSGFDVLASEAANSKSGASKQHTDATQSSSLQVKVDHSISNQCTLWKYSPTIELNIVEC